MVLPVQKTLKITKPCIFCKKEHFVIVPEDKYLEWINGDKLIQNVMPEVSLDDREFLISGVCPTCFDTL